MIKVSNLSKSFHGNLILDDISVDIEKGDVVALIGSSGAGKSTFLRSLNCLEKANKGLLDLEGLKVDFSKITSNERLELRKQTAMVFQQFNLFQHRTALDNVKEGLKVVKKMKDKDATEIAKRQLEQVGLAERAHYYPKHLSGGQQQRVGIARALAMEPKLLLLDEPTSALDPELVGEVLQTIKKTAASGQTMLLVSHEMSFVYEVANKVLFLDKGKIVEEGTPDEVFNHPKSQRAKEFLQNYFRNKSGNL
ncbi:amino acid ABC transporter ATP-binding protein [Paenibacillus sp. ACRRY]|uniref:amino acid ABC transporter ATP-binding protein n=1 Tax=Paenibacillus sp. ACRRY TaxID=2918208 RepID=UPI001EF41C8C|nr:amino acid ABC transporter ATP-binding protein [Paenibacillus sp. ACRRY]MCG7381440.1 amino acid ABC transporter ATP-binding protein [Paenibacillus sp. ACRRY]